MSASARRCRAFLDAEPPLLFAHRGGAKLWPENTLLAFRSALEAGIRYLETDVHATRDGELVVHHDARVDRTTDGQGLVRRHTLAELKRLDAAYRFSPDGKSFPYRGKGLTIPTLEEAFSLSENALYNIELKQRRPSIVRKFWRFLVERDLCDRVLVAAAQDSIGRAFRKVGGARVATSAAEREVAAFWLASRAHAARFLPVSYDALQVPARHGPVPLVDRRFVRAAHGRGLQVHVWTIDEPREMRRLLDLGVDGIMSDRPDLLLEVAGERGESPSAE